MDMCTNHVVPFDADIVSGLDRAHSVSAAAAKKFGQSKLLALRRVLHVSGFVGVPSQLFPSTHLECIAAIAKARSLG